MRIGLVGCGKSKLDHSAPARELYTGPLFRAALRYAEATCDRVFVLSAKHGLLDLDTVIEPYDLRLKDLSPDELLSWGDAVSSAVMALTGTPTEIIVLAGRDYSEALPLADGWTLTEPMFGMQVGERLRWLRENTPAPRAEEPTDDDCDAEPAGDANQLAAEVLDWEAQFGPSSDEDVCEVAGEDMVRWVRMARAIAGVQA